jgi:pSer/pThr/pTyr-binding forkhead associated (FHA) protein
MSQQPTDLFATSCGATVPLELNVSGPGQAGAGRHIFDHPFVLVGRDERNGILLDDPEVSRRHAYLQQLGGRVFCVDLGSRTGIRWEGEPRPAGWLRLDQRIQIGPFTLELAKVLRAGEGPVEAAAEHGDPLQDRVCDPHSLPQLTVEVGNEVKSRLQLNRELVLVGSAPGCRVRLRDASISRYHCSLVRTPEGVWVIDLLSGSGTCLNGQPIRWAMVKEGDQLQVGPYVLRVSHQDVSKETSRHSPAEIPARTPAPSAGDTPESGGLPPGNQVSPAPSAAAVSVLTPALQAKLDAIRERQRDTEDLRQQLAESQAECDRLREQAHALEARAAESARLQAQLEAAEARASELDSVRGERDRWQAEARGLQARLASDLAEREQLGRLAADLDAARMERDRLQTEQQASLHSAEQACASVSELERALTEAAEGHKTALEGARARWESENQALEACLAQERQAHAGATEAAVRDAQARVAELERVLKETTEGHKTALEDARARWESERQALEACHVQQRQDQAEAIETAIRDAQARVCDLERTLSETAESHKAALEGDRARWESENQALEACLAQERQSRVGANESAVRDAQVRVSELERALTEAAENQKTALEDAHTRWESERQDLEARLAQERQGQAGAIEAAVRDVQARVAAEREEWQKRVEGAELQLVWERKMFQEWGEQVRQQAAQLQAERNRVAARLAQAESFLRAAEERSRTDAGAAAELEHLRQQAAREQVFAEISSIRLGRPREIELPRQPSSAENKAGGEGPHQ